MSLLARPVPSKASQTGRPYIHGTRQVLHQPDHRPWHIGVCECSFVRGKGLCPSFKFNILLKKASLTPRHDLLGSHWRWRNANDDSEICPTKTCPHKLLIEHETKRKNQWTHPMNQLPLSLPVSSAMISMHVGRTCATMILTPGAFSFRWWYCWPGACHDHQETTKHPSGSL